MQHLNLWEGKGQNNFPLFFPDNKKQSKHSFISPGRILPLLPRIRTEVAGLHTHKRHVYTPTHTSTDHPHLFVCVFHCVCVCIEMLFTLKVLPSQRCLLTPFPSRKDPAYCVRNGNSWTRISPKKWQIPAPLMLSSIFSSRWHSPLVDLTSVFQRCRYLEIRVVCNALFTVKVQSIQEVQNFTFKSFIKFLVWS